MSSIKTIESVKSNDLFKGINFDTINFPFDTKNFLEFKEGDLIYSSGQPSDFIYLIVNGEIKIKLNSIKRLFFKSPNEFFGEAELLQKELRSSSAVANSDCLIYKIDNDSVGKLLNESSEFRGNLLRDETGSDQPLNAAAGNKPVSKQFEVSLEAQTLKVDIKDLIETSPKYQTSIDIDKIEISHYEQEPDLDAFIQKKYLESDNKSLKSKLIDDPDDMTNWVITEGSLEAAPDSKSALLTSAKSSGMNKNDSVKTAPVDLLNNLNPSGSNNKSTLPQASNNINKTAKDVLEYILHKTDSKAGAIYLYSQDSQMLEEIYQTNESIYRGKKSIKEGITGIVAKEKEIRLAVSFLNDINYNQDIDRPNDFVGESLIIIPFLDDKKNLIGIAQLGSNETMFTKEEERKIKEYADYGSKILQQTLTLIPKETVINKPDLSQLSNFIMQDVKAPLLTIKHYSSILSRFDLPEEVKKVISLLSSQANSVIDLLQSSIDFSDKNTKIKFELVSFNEVMDNNLTLLSDYVESRNVKLFKKLGEDAKIKIDTRKFYVACYYISRFSCDLMKQGGNLYFSSNIDGANIILNIKDGNKIVSSDLKENVFDPGFANSSNENVGLSMAIAKFIIDSMNGTITLQNSETGTSYLVSIPISS